MDEFFNSILEGIGQAIGEIFGAIFVKFLLSKPWLIIILIVGGIIVWMSSHQNSKTVVSEYYNNFPKSSCGDPKPTNPSAYPVNFYPVYVPYSEFNLAKVKSKFCSDAFKNRRNNGEEVIQVASFTSQEMASKFAQFVQSQISGAIVGPPTTVIRP